MFHRDRVGLPRRRRARAAARGRVLPVRRLPRRHRDVRRARRGQRAGRAPLADRSASSIAFLLYLNLFFAPIQQLSQVFDSYQQARVAIDRITELLVDARRRVPPPAQPVVPGRLARRRRARAACTSSTPTAVDEALRGIDLHVNPGETVALVGETGAGKSTVVKLVARFYDPTSGAVRVDGVDGRRLRPGRVPPAARRRAPGGVPLLGHDPRQHRLRPQGRHRRRGRGRGARGRRPRLHRLAPRRLPASG